MGMMDIFKKHMTGRKLPRQCMTKQQKLRRKFSGTNTVK